MTSRGGVAAAGSCAGAGGSGAERAEPPLFVQEVGRMKIELFADVVPKTAENFR